MIDSKEREARIAARLRQRHRAEKRFRALGLIAIFIGIGFLAVLFATILFAGAGTLKQTVIKLDVEIAAPASGDADALMRIDYQGLVKQKLRNLFPEVQTRQEKRALNGLLSSAAGFELRKRVLRNPELLSEPVAIWLTASDDVDLVFTNAALRSASPQERRLSDQQLAWIDTLESQGRLTTRFNRGFFLNGDSREPEVAGIAVAVIGSLFALLVCLALSFPLGVLTAVYLEEFAPRSRWVAFIEVNINNLAAVPSIVFGLLGLAVFLNFFHLPRSAPLVGGMVLALMTLPTIIIAGRAALESVPPSIRQAALAVGATPIQAVFHHVLPLAMPGVLTGSIIGTARALGETAPLLMIGMVAFVVDIPQGVLSPATALPVQVYLWADSPELAFQQRTAAAILVLLAFTFMMNFAAVILRRRFETRW